MRVWPAIRAVLATGPAPSARAEAAANLTRRWRTPGEPDRPRPRRQGRRPGRGRHGRRLAGTRRRGHGTRSSGRSSTAPRGAHGAERRPGPGRLRVHLRLVRVRRQGPANAPRPTPCAAPFSRRYCGAGVLATCRDALWDALDAGCGASSRRRRGRRRRGGARTRRPSGSGSRRACSRHDALDEPPDVPAAHVVLVATGRGDDYRRADRALRAGTLGSRHAAKRYLMAPGPTPVPPEVLAAGAAPIIHHRGPDFRELMLRTLERLGEVCRTRERRPALHRVRIRRVRVRGREPPLAGRARPRRHRGRVRRALGEAREPRTAPTSTSSATRWGETPQPEDVRAAARGDGRGARLPRALGDVDRRRRRRARRSPRQRGTRARSSSSTPCRASARSRSRPTRGGSTSSSPARRRRS